MIKITCRKNVSGLLNERVPQGFSNDYSVFPGFRLGKVRVIKARLGSARLG